MIHLCLLALPNVVGKVSGARRFPEVPGGNPGPLPGLPRATSVSKESGLLPSDSRSPMVAVVTTTKEVEIPPAGWGLQSGVVPSHFQGGP